MDILEQIALQNNVPKKTVDAVVRHVFKTLRVNMSKDLKPYRVLGLGTFSASPAKICSCHRQPVKFIGKKIARCKVTKQVCLTLAQAKIKERIEKGNDK